VTIQSEKIHQLGLGGDGSLKSSEALFQKARQFLAGGIASSARSIVTGPAKHPLYICRGRGSRIWDPDGHEFIDYLISYGSVILGHADPALGQVIKSQFDQGTMYGTCNTVEIELAEQICRMVKSAELVRFANSGSEAISGAVRAARGFTGKSKILKFEGHYHGWADVLAISNRPSAEEAGPLEAPNSIPHSPGLPQGVVNDVVICPWNEPEIFKAILDRHDGQIAAVIAEPIVANNACIMPRAGYLEFLREQCSQRGIVLIFDEIVTGFRTAPGGAQELFGVEADLSVFSKALGGGLPISAFAGKRKIMDLIGANRVKHGGTYNGNPLCAAAALHTLRTLAAPAVQERIRRSGEAVMEAIRRAAKDCRVPVVVQGLGSMFQVLFTDRAPVHYRDLRQADAKRYASFRYALLQRGVHCNETPFACWFVSAAHRPEDVELTVAAVGSAMRTLAG
jgi:glutamate-1-semialdehyde 2,1-aminomutase